MPIAVLIAAIVQVAIYKWHFSPIKEIASPVILVEWFLALMSLPWVQPVLNTLCIVLTCSLLMRMDTQHRLYPTKSNLCFTTYILVACSNLTIASSDYLLLYSLIMVLSIGALFDCYNLKEGHIPLIFNIFFLCSLVSLFDLTILIYIPILLFGIYRMRVMSFNTVIALLIGMALPYLLYLFWTFYTDVPFVIATKIPMSLVAFDGFQPYEWVHLTYTSLLTLIAIFHSVGTTRITKIKTRLFLGYIIFLIVYSFAVYLFCTEEENISLGVFYLFSSFLIGRYFSTNITPITNNIYLLSIAFYFVTFIWSIWLS